MKVLGKDQYITKFETFIVIKKELEYVKNLNNQLCSNIILNKNDSCKEVNEKKFMKILLDRILYNSIQKYIIDTSQHLIPKDFSTKNYVELQPLFHDISRKIINFIKTIDVYNFDKKKKIQMIDINCVNFVDLYVIMNYGDKKCEENQIEHVLKLLEDIHTTKSIEDEQ
ncbi:DNA-directed RNA polymerase II subunit RPB4, putative [Hepatocystis sp. ex Piliocolobus tephrosceles]|nr:DNA-directed RNA polymerase II subunit RPB4, putative [Hepatocystis sp. ex Piliocolobus tephrosceles]